MKQFITRFLDILLYGFLLVNIADHTNTVGIQILCVIALILFIALDIFMYVVKKPQTNKSL